jgi:hypothetical protein
MDDKKRELQFLKEMTGGLDPDTERWFLDVYGNDPEFKKAVDEFCFNRLWLQRGIRINS